MRITVFRFNRIAIIVLLTCISFYGIDIVFDEDSTFNSIGLIGGGSKNGYSYLFRILRLTNREFKFEQTLNYNNFGKTYLLELKKE